MKCLFFTLSLLAVSAINAAALAPAVPGIAKGDAWVPESMQHCPENYHQMSEANKAANEKIYQENLAKAAEQESKIATEIVQHTPIKIKDLAAIIATYARERVLWGCSIKQALQRDPDYKNKSIWKNLHGITDLTAIAGQSYSYVHLAQNPIRLTKENAFEFLMFEFKRYDLYGIYNGLPCAIFLILRQCGLSHLPDNWISNQPYITRLILSENRFTKVPSSLAWSGPLYLEDIYLEDNQITEVSYADFASAPFLCALFLKNNRLTSFPTKDMLQLRFLTHVDVTGNPLNGPLPPQEQAALIHKTFKDRTRTHGQVRAVPEQIFWNKKAVMDKLKKKFGRQG